MQDIHYKEQREHGTSLAPVEVYSFYERLIPFQVSHHWHEVVEILYIEQGEFILERDMQPEELSEGDIVFVNRTELHQLQAKTIPTVHHAMVFDMRMLCSEIVDLAQGNLMMPLLTGKCRFPAKINAEHPYYTRLLALYKEVKEECEYRQEGWYLTVKSSLFGMLALMERAGMFVRKSTKEWEESEYRVQEIKQVLQYIHEHVHEKIHLSELAGVAGMNEQYFCRFFKGMTGKTPVDYMNGYRIEQIAELLAKSNKKIIEICYENGFENFSYFIRKFKEYKGVTPKEYRKLQQNVSVHPTEGEQQKHT